MLRPILAAVAVAALVGALATRPPVQQWSVVVLVMTVVVWMLQATGRFFFEGERRVRPGQVVSARWMERPRRVLALTLRDGTTAILDDPNVALAMAVALKSRGIPVEGEPHA